VSIKGEKVVLRPMTVEEMPLFYEWATQSDGTAYWYGELVGDDIPTREKFFRGWKSHYFDGTAPEKGRCFVILVNDRAIGQVNYNAINADNRSVELDIIIANNEDMNKGYGSDALKALIRYLFENMNIRRCWIEPGEYNRRAIKAYEKAGFKHVTTYIKNDRRLVILDIRNPDT